LWTLPAALHPLLLLLLLWICGPYLQVSGVANALSFTAPQEHQQQHQQIQW
jgi:hypothetical protein